MLDDDSPGLGVDFTINPADSFNQINQLMAVMNSAEGKILASANQIENSTADMVKLTGATAGVTAFAATAKREMSAAAAAVETAGLSVESLGRTIGKSAGMSILGPAATSEAAAATREINRTEKEIDKLVFALDREAASVGKTREELRGMKIESLALTAAQQGNTEAADRLFASSRALSAAQQALAEDRASAGRKAEAAAEAEATALREAGFAYQQFEARVRQGMVALREQEAAAERDAAAMARLREMLDPAAAAQDRLNRELVDARRVMLAAGASAEEVARAEQLLTARTIETARSSGAAKASMQNLGFQLQDFSVQVVGGTSVLRAFAMQFPQAAGALTGFEGKLGKVGGFLAGPWGIALTLGITLLAGFADKLFESGNAAEKAAEGLKKFQDRQSDIANFIDATTGKLTEQNRTLVLNAVLTRQAQMADNAKAISEQRNTAFRTAGNQQTRAPSYTGSSVGAPIAMRQTDPDVQRAIQAAAGNVDKLATSIARLAATSRPDLKPLALDLSTTAGAAILATRENEKLGKELRALNGDTAALGSTTTSAIGRQVALATATTPLARARAQLALVEQGAAAADKAGGVALVKYRTDLTAATKAVNAAEAAQKSETAARRDATRQASMAARLGRDADAVEAQVRNLNDLTKAYDTSGAAALIAEARLKAESQAIRQQADVTAAVARQVNLVVAQRVNDAAKGTAAMRDQARVQDEVNAEIAAGNVPAERAAELLRDRISDLPLLAAIEAAQQTKNLEGADAAIKALDEQRAARVRLTESENAGRLAGAMAAGKNRIAELNEELRLIGASDAVRVRALATLRATQEAEAANWTGKKGADYVAQQVAIAEKQQALAEMQERYNDALNFTADKWDLIGRNVQNAATGMADAFGEVGRAIGDIASIYAGYQADRARLDARHMADLKKAGSDQAAIDRANSRFALASSTAQVGAFGDMASAAKGFFNEKSKGYAAMAAAEKAFRAIEFALSVRAMAQDAIETGSAIAKTVARTAVSATEAVVNAIKSLPFPLNLVAGAATAAAVASLGVAIVGSFGGGSKNTLAKPNEGTGTVLGDSAAKSESIKNAIDALKEVDLLTNSYSRQMAASLKSIDNQIGGVAALVVRAGNIDASTGVTEGFKPNMIGSVLGKIPVVGGILSSLFGSKTTVIGSGLYGGAQSVGSILNGGFDASYYSDIEKKKKVFGITTGTKTSTQYSDADAGLENQFTLMLRQFNDAITAAAGPLGVATSEVQARLNGFVVSIGKIDLKGLTGEQIEEKLSAVFGAAADGMAAAAFPAVAQFQKVGEGTFETLVRVASTVEAVGTSLDMLGTKAQSMGIGVKLGLADQFDSVSDLTSAAEAYFQAFYSKEEQAAAKTAQMTRVLASLGLAMPDSIAAFASWSKRRTSTPRPVRQPMPRCSSSRRRSRICKARWRAPRALRISPASAPISSASCSSCRATPQRSGRSTSPRSTSATADCSSRSGRCRTPRPPRPLPTSCARRGPPSATASPTR